MLYSVPRICLLILLSLAGLWLPFSSKVALCQISGSERVAQTDREEILRRQQEAERALKEGERLRRDIRDSGFGGGDLERRINREVTKIRESGANPQQVREAQSELERLRGETDRVRYYYSPYYYPYYYIPTITAPIIFTTPGDVRFSTPGASESPTTVNDRGFAKPLNDRDRPKFTISAGFKDGLINPGVGVRWQNIGFEFGAIFNQDSLPGILNDFSLPANFLFNDLGEKKVSAQYGGDILGYFDVNSSVSLYGGVGIYVQSKSRIAQSQATNELYKQTDNTIVTTSVTAGMDYNLSDAVNIGIGYHSIRGVNGRIGISF
jgi:opacity protein-like surface antigen